MMEATQETVQQVPEQEESGESKRRKRLPIPVPSKGKKWKKRLVVLVVLAVVGYWFFLRPHGDGTGGALAGQYFPSPVERRDLTVSVSGTGTLMPVESYKVGALVSGDILEAPFEVGDQIEKGDLLYRVDAGDAETSVEQAQLAVRQAQLSYDEILQGMKPAPSAAGVVQKLLVQKGEVVSPGTPIAEVSDTSVMTLTLPFQSADAATLAPGQQADVMLSGTLETLVGTVESISSAELVGNGGALVRQVKIRVQNPGALAAGSSATAMVGQIACAGSGTLEANTQQTVTAQISGEVTEIHVTAGSGISAGGALVTLGGTSAQNSLENASIALENAKLSLRKAQEALDNYTITAPIAGTVIEKNFKSGDKVDSMDSGSLAVLYDLTSLKLQMNVSELNIGQVKPGQEVEITAEAVPGQVFHGVVERVSINGTTTDGFTTYPVTVVLKEYGELNPGMNVSAEIIVERAENVLTVPVEAVNSDNTVLLAGPEALSPDKTAVADLSKAVPQSVTLGRGDKDYVEVVTGLQEGDTVLVLNQAIISGETGTSETVVVAGG
ncbi:MAG: efflux RND transporter periplasmic adaptor subunit [Lawsonibacter sp.]